MFNHTT